MAVLAGLAPTIVTVRDRFNDNEVNTNFWLELQDGGVTLAETNKRLEFTADGSTGDFSYALLEVKNWGAKWRYDFEIEMDYRLDVGNLGQNKDVLLCMVLSFDGVIPDTFTGYVAAIEREGDDLFLFLQRFANGDAVQTDDAPLAEAQGVLTLEYDRSNDRLEARAGGEEVHLNGVWSRFGETYGSDPLVIAIGCVTTDGNVSFPGRRVRLDNFEFTGVTKAR